MDSLLIFTNLSIIILSYNIQKVSLLIIIDISFVKYNIVEYRLKTLEQTSYVLVDKLLSKIIPATVGLKTISYHTHNPQYQHQQ